MPLPRSSTSVQHLTILSDSKARTAQTTFVLEQSVRRVTTLARAGSAHATSAFERSVQHSATLSAFTSPGGAASTFTVGCRCSSICGLLVSASYSCMQPVYMLSLGTGGEWACPLPVGPVQQALHGSALDRQHVEGCVVVARHDHAGVVDVARAVGIHRRKRVHGACKAEGFLRGWCATVHAAQGAHVPLGSALCPQGSVCSIPVLSAQAHRCASHAKQTKHVGRQDSGPATSASAGTQDAMSMRHTRWMVTADSGAGTLCPGGLLLPRPSWVVCAWLSRSSTSFQCS